MSIDNLYLYYLRNCDKRWSIHIILKLNLSIWPNLYRTRITIIGLKGRGIWPEGAFHKDFIERWYDLAIIDIRDNKLNELICYIF